MADYKKCRGPCGRILPITEFGKHKMMADGHLNFCKKCRQLAEAEWRLKNPERSKLLREKATKKYLSTTHGKKNRSLMQMRREALQQNRIPAWSNQFFIEEVYELCALRNSLRTCGTKWEVDHIVPMSSEFVCGLHTEANLRVIPEFDNRSKKNYFWPDMW